MKYGIVQTCPFCGKESTMELNEESMIAYDKYLCEGGYVQDIPVNDRDTEKEKSIAREFLKMGTCRECQKEIFG